MTHRDLLIVVLAAGKGTRMKSALPKVLHKIAGRSMLGHVLALAQASGPDTVAVVVGPGMEDVRAKAWCSSPSAQVFVQESARARPMRCSRRATHSRRTGRRPRPLCRHAACSGRRRSRGCMPRLDAGAAIAVLGFEATDPAGYGRLLTGAAAGCPPSARTRMPARQSAASVSATPASWRSAATISSACSAASAMQRQGRILPDRRRRDRARRRPRAAAVACTEDEVLGINARDQLAAAEAIFQQRARLRSDARRRHADRAGHGLVHLRHRIGRDVIIEPNVFFGPGVTVDDGAEIKANCHIEGAHIGAGARVGPFARLRPGADIGATCTSATSSRSRMRRWATAPRPTISPIWAMATSARTPTSAPARSSATTTASTSTGPRSARALHRLQLLAGRAGQDRRRRLHRLGQRHHQGRRGRTPWRSSARAGGAPRLGREVPRHDATAQSKSMTKIAQMCRAAPGNHETFCDLSDIWIER